jgi:hypothetical protein
MPESEAIYTHAVIVTSSMIQRCAHLEWHINLTRAQEAAKAFHNSGTGDVLIYAIVPENCDMVMIKRLSDAA